MQVPRLKALRLALVGAIAALTAWGSDGLRPSRAQTVSSGRVAGVVRLAAGTARRLTTAGAYPNQTVTVVPRRASSELDNVVVFVRRAERVATAPRRVEIRQVAEEFVPHVVAITVGSTVDFPNDDLVFHNVFSLSSAATFDLGRYPQHSSRPARSPSPASSKSSAISTRT
jgi:plastocyanin